MHGTFWGVVEPDDPAARRVALHMGLRSALSFYGELSVPGIGGARFVRQIVWPCLAIALKDGDDQRKIRSSSPRLATAIEALACKLWLEAHPNSSIEDRKRRIAGIRRLPSRGLTFRELGSPQGYVTNPMRRGATRALPSQEGLGFATGGFRLSQMVLTQQGEHLVANSMSAKIHHGTTLKRWLSAWASGSVVDEGTTSSRNLLSELNPLKPSENQRQVVMAALLRDTDRGVPGQRRRLIEKLQSSKFAEELDPESASALLARLPTEDARRMRTAWAFRRLLTASQLAVRQIALELAVPGAKPLIAAVCRDGSREALDRVCETARDYLQNSKGSASLGHPDAKKFATALATTDRTKIAGELIDRADSLLRREGERLVRGPAFSERWLNVATIDGDEGDDDGIAESPVSVDLPPRLTSLTRLLHDCGGS